MSTIRQQRPVITVIEHESTCPIDQFGAWLNADLRIVRPYLGDEIPEQPDDALIVLGGTEHALADTQWPWLPGVRRLLSDATVLKRPTLGICLGHQLLGVALGGKLMIGAQSSHDPSYRGPEYGATDISLTEEGKTDPLLGAGSAIQVVTMMHGDVLSALPPGAIRLATTARYHNAAFRFGSAAWGVQFHPEASAATLERWVHATPDLDATSQSKILTTAAEKQPAIDPFARHIAEQFGRIAVESLGH